ncbi:hypothetical protein Dtur_1285 [Sporocytophaga myxococcoides]|uniref:PKD domain-containing protein n=2 Tax=Sporocytophaga myxococcoides TaxID=153721 RepID=A0A098LKX7_9BACT|nr:hypothetical protein Dtur_1285 [Sporocytophaga myxococcoides]
MLVANMIENSEVDGILIKVDAKGDVQWNKRFGKPEVIDLVVSGLQNRDGEYIIATTYDPESTIYDEEVNFWRFDGKGNLIVEANITYSGICCWDVASGKIKQTSDGNYIFPKISFGISTISAGIIKVDKNGSYIWGNSFSGNGRGVEDVLETKNGDILNCGGIGDGFVRKLDENGRALLHKSFRHPLSKANSGNSIPTIIEQSDGFLFPVNFVDEKGNNTWLVKTDFKLDTLWTKTISGTGRVFGMEQNEEGRIILISAADGPISNGDIVSVVLDENYNIQGKRYMGTFKEDRITDINKASDGSFIVAGVSYFIGEKQRDLLLVKLDNDACIKPIAGFDVLREEDQTGVKLTYSQANKFILVNDEDYTWFYDAGDGYTTTEQNVILHEYEKQDNYIVSQIVGNGCATDTIQKSVNAVCIGEPYEFSIKDTHLDVVFGYTPESTFWNWDFGDGSTANGKVVSHHYEVPGVYNVCLSTDNACGPARLCDSVKVDCSKPVLNLKKEIIACAGPLFSLDVTSPGLSYFWSTGETTSKINITSPGIYWVEAKNVCGAVTRDTVRVSFVNPPVIELASVLQACYGEDFILNYPSSDNFTFSWYINGAFISSGNGLHYRFPNPGDYNLKVEVSNGDCSLSKSAIVKVNKTQVCKPYCVPNYSTGTSTGNFIKTVVFNTINNSNSGSAGGPSYTDYTDKFTTNLIRGKQYGITVTCDLKSSLYYGVWIDYNQDGKFDKATERITSDNAHSNTSTTYFTLRSGIPLGPMVMRVRLMDAISYSNVDPCSDANVGETEDYQLFIVPDCPVINLTGTVVDESCEGGNGAIDVKVSGGTAPYTYLWNNGAKVQNLKGVGSATYSVTATDSKGCTSTNNWNVKKGRNMMSVSVDTNPATENLCDGSAIVNVVNTIEGRTVYTWDKGLPSTSSQYGLCPGRYKVNVWHSMVCSIEKDVMIGISTVTSIGKNEEVKDMLEIYPNPFSDDVLNFEVMSDEGEAKLSLRTLSGMPVVEDENMSLKSGLNKMTFSTGSIKPGVYILSITTSKGSTHKRVIKK